MDSLKSFVFTMKLMGKRRRIYLLAIFFMSTSFAMFSVMSSLLMKNVVDAAQTGDSKKMLTMIIINIVGGIVSLLIYRQSAVVYNVEAKRAVSVLSKKMFHHEVRLSYDYYEQHHSGELMSKLSYDSSKMGSIYGSRFRRTVSPILQVIVFLIPMMILSYQVTLCLVAVNIVMLLINGLMIKPMQTITKVLSKTNIHMTEALSDLLQGMEQARMYTAGKDTVYDVILENETYAKQSNKKILYTAILESGNKGFDLLCSLAFLMVGIYFVQNGQTSLGALAAIYTLYSHFSVQFLMLGRYMPELIGCFANVQNIQEFLAVPEEGDRAEADREEIEREASGMKESVQKSVKKRSVDSGAGMECARTTSSIAFNNVNFSYSEDKPLLNQFCMDIKKDECVAITGESGCGKTTLSKLILGLYPIHSGDITFDGKSYCNMSNEQIRKNIAYVPQEPYLFNLSIKENIRVGNMAATDEEVMNAAKLAHAHEFIMGLEEGYDSMAGERGNRLSGGQRQRIAIARAILKDAPVLLLDEATSALDNESEKLVNDAMKSLQHNKTIIMIAHRPSTIALADRVVQVR